MPISRSGLIYEERRDVNGWYAFQEYQESFRVSERNYPTREDLVADMAFGKLKWKAWNKYG
jgi:hypothetical protein